MWSESVTHLRWVRMCTKFKLGILKKTLLGRAKQRWGNNDDINLK